MTAEVRLPVIHRATSGVAYEGGGGTWDPAHRAAALRKGLLAKLHTGLPAVLYGSTYRVACGSTNRVACGSTYRVACDSTYRDVCDSAYKAASDVTCRVACGTYRLAGDIAYRGGVQVYVQGRCAGCARVVPHHGAVAQPFSRPSQNVKVGVGKGDYTLGPSPTNTNTNSTSMPIRVRARPSTVIDPSLSIGVQDI